MLSAEPRRSQRTPWQGGSWVVIRRVIRPRIRVISIYIVTLLMTPHITTHKPPSGKVALGHLTLTLGNTRRGLQTIENVWCIGVG